MAVRVLPDDPHDARLLQHVHPPNWVNPEPAPVYNLVVIGAGVAGLVTAAGGAGLGARVALVERDLMGGDCLNVGCVPSKALLAAGRVAATVRRASAFGVETDPRVMFPTVMERLRRLRADISPNDSAERFKGLGVDVFLGQAQFTGVDTVSVGDKTLRFRKALIATGALADKPDIAGLEEVGYLTNETVFALQELPARLAILGGGPIGCELAQAFARLGSKVTLIQLRDRLLPRDDPEASKLVEKSLCDDGVEVILGTVVQRASLTPAGKSLKLDSRESVVVDEIVAAVGRRPNLDGLQIGTAGVQGNSRDGVQVDDCLRTTNPRIFAAGDVCSRFQFTHAADAMARIVIQNALFLGRKRVSALTIPWCTYTDPEVAHIGLTEEEAAREKIPVRTFRQDLHHVDRAILDGEGEGFVKIHVWEGSDEIVGATIVAAHAGELISQISLAMTNGLGLKKIANTIYPYPTQGEAIKKVGDAFNRTRLTPWVKWLFERWLAWCR